MIGSRGDHLPMLLGCELQQNTNLYAKPAAMLMKKILSSKRKPQIDRLNDLHPKQAYLDLVF